MKRNRKLIYMSWVRYFFYKDDIGGGRTLSNLLLAPINAYSLASGNLVVCIVVDLANPGASIDNILFWLATLRECAQKAI